MSPNPFSTVKTRSVYSALEHRSQTKTTIRTIEDYLPYAFIVFVDNSYLPTVMKIYLIKRFDVFGNTTHDVLRNAEADHSLV